MTLVIQSRCDQKPALDLKTIQSFFSALLGTLIEYYDYALYGFCASVMVPLFFEASDPVVTLLKGYGIFLMGSVSKPLGALIFGHIGDRFGRSVSLKISMLGITLPTLLIGCLPTYQSVGWWAPAGLLLCRIAQGIFTQGESDGARIYVYELLGEKHPCLANSLVGVVCMLGIYLASLVASWVLISPMPAYTWRFAFIAGGCLGLLVFWSRRYLRETVVFTDYEKDNRQFPKLSFWATVANHKRLIASTILLCGSVGGGYHFYLVFLGNFLSTLHILDPKVVALTIPKALLMYMVVAPLSAMLADKFGAWRILKISFIGLLIAALLNMLMVSQGVMPLWLIWVTAGILSFFQAPGFVLLLQGSNVGTRYRSVSLGHAMGSMLFSGTTPFISLGLWHLTGCNGAPFVWFITLILMGYGALLLLKPLVRIP